jgi:hypothetical protein
MAICEVRFHICNCSYSTFSSSQAFVCVLIVVSYLAIFPIIYRLLAQARETVANVQLVALQVRECVSVQSPQHACYCIDFIDCCFVRSRMRL